MESIYVTDVLLVMAMRGEAAPVADALSLTRSDRTTPAPIDCYTSDDERIVLAVNGLDPLHGVDAIGTTAASRTSEWAATTFSPRWMISAGTAGGFIERGGAIGTVVVASGPVIFHDRRVPIPGFDRYARGEFPSADLDDVARALGFVPGPCSTGDSLDAPTLDLQAMAAHGTYAKDMEAAAVAWTALRYGSRFTAVKVITDLVDGPEATADEFTANFAAAVSSLADAISPFLDALGD